MSDMCCDRCIDNAESEEEADAIGSIVFDEHENVFCSQRCLDNSNAEAEQRNAAIEKCTMDFLAKFPYATVTDVWIGGPGQCECFRKDNYNACLHWTVPGGTIQHGNSYCGGCKKAWVCNGDLEAFEKAKLYYIERNG